jgi:uncharacterized repeat protein (TIGR03809 family)
VPVASASVFLLTGSSMTHRLDVTRGGDVLARWCALAEARLEYLTELFETGRWRRYHSELAFLENIQEAKAAFEIWRDLSSREASRDNSAIDISWLGQGSTATLPREGLRDQMHRPQPRPMEIASQPPPSDVLTAAEAEHVFSDDAPSAPALDRVPEPMLAIAAIEQRYPLLRNAL